MIGQNEVLKLSAMPQKTRADHMQIESPQAIVGPTELVVFVDPEAPKTILQHPIFGPILQTHADALFVTDPKSGKQTLRSETMAIALPNPVMGSVKVLHVTAQGSLKGRYSDDDFPTPNSWRAAGNRLTDVIKNVASSKNPNLGLYIDNDLMDETERDNILFAMHSLARGMGNRGYNENLFKSHKADVYVDGKLPEKKEDVVAPEVAAIQDGLRRAVQRVYLVNDKTDDQTKQLYDDMVTAFEEGDQVSRAQVLCRFLAECPHNLLDCETFLMVIKNLVEDMKNQLDADVDMEVFGPTEGANIVPMIFPLGALNLNGLKAVHQGSTGELGPFMVRVRYRHPELVGKNIPVDIVVAKCVMQDDGGHCAKGAAAKSMQADMTGGAAAAAILAMYGENKPITNTDFVFGIVSNTTDGEAYKVNDILTLSAGVTVEIDNTDAEGRIVLADVGGGALRLQRREGVETGTIHTLSTLTGHAVLVGGHDVVLNSANRKVARTIEDKGITFGEGIQPLHLKDFHFETVGDGTAADLKNVVKMPVGSANACGTQTGHAFIAKGMGLSKEARKKFVGWDIAPTLEFGEAGPKDTSQWRLPVGNFLATLYQAISEES